jgi:hypothetical protein
VLIQTAMAINSENAVYKDLLAQQSREVGRRFSLRKHHQYCEYYFIAMQTHETEIYRFAAKD